MTIEEAKEELKKMPFPELSEGDIVWYPDTTGHRFKWESGDWVSFPVE